MIVLKRVKRANHGQGVTRLHGRPSDSSRWLRHAARTAGMNLEFHQLDLRFEHLRVRRPDRERKLLASLAAAGQQIPIVVVAVREQVDRYLVIDGYKRIAALKHLGRDTVSATVWSMSESEALVLEQSMRASEGDSALEQGWLLSELEHRFGYSLDELARQFDRSISWVSRRLALVELLPDSVQQQIRSGKIPPHVAMKYLVPVARANVEHCERMAAAVASHKFSSREAGELYAAWRDTSPQMRNRILQEPALFLKARRSIHKQELETESAGAVLLRDLEMLPAIASRAGRRWRQSAALMDGTDLDRARHCVANALDELERLARRIEQEKKPYVEQESTHDDSRVAQPGDENPADCQSTGILPASCPESHPIELLRSSFHSSFGARTTAPAANHGTVCCVQRQSGPGP
jgi:ParB family transcriptional regulator, chromosome partitioning protein